MGETLTIQLPVDCSRMASRRVLANVPNAVNSPFRNAASQKRSRGAEDAYGQPPAKKQMIDSADGNIENVDPKRRNVVAVVAREKLEEPFMKRTSNAPPTAFERKLASVREKKPTVQQRAEQPAKAHAVARDPGENEESLRQWRRHYKRQFPSFVFYFDNGPADQRVSLSRMFGVLGAREERFFSKQVTHVVTTRAIPAESTSTSPNEDVKYEGVSQKPAQPTIIDLTQDQRKTTSLLDATLQRRAQSHTSGVPHDVEPRRAQAQSTDILSRARELNIKIWSLEKLQRVLRTILELEEGDVHPDIEKLKRHAPTTKLVANFPQDVDLEQLLRNEKINGPADRDMTVAAQDMVGFKSYFIYIHDMDEKTKPVMIRDYEKPQTKEQGKWPQFRLTPIGRCPFVEDPAHTKRLQQQDRAASKAEEELALQRKARATAPSRVLAECESNLRRSPRKTVQQHTHQSNLAKPLEPPKHLPTKRQSSAEGIQLFGSAQQNIRGLPRMIGGEPMASGVHQHSNITSAIRSQLVSSTAISSTAPTAAGGIPRRVGDSKEVSALKRKVLERGGAASTYSMPPSSYMNDMRAAINNNEHHDPPPRAAKRKAQETLLGVLREDEEDEDGRARPQRKSAAPLRKRKPVPKEAKPGYCENCRDKFDDFDDHVNSRKHRKYGLTAENWKELDALLVKLRRPHKAT